MLRTQVDGIFLENFQSIRSPTFIKFSELTFLYGPNSAGKSSLVDALQFLRKRSQGGSTRTENRRWLHKRGAGEMHSRSNFRVGLSIRVEKDWPNLVKQNWLISDAKNQWGEQPHLDWMDSLVGHTIQIEFESYTSGQELTCEKFAVDGVPVVVADGISSCSSDDFYIKPSDLTYEGAGGPLEGEFISGSLELNFQHWLFQNNLEIPGLMKVVSTENNEGLSSLFESNGVTLNIHDLDFHENWSSRNTWRRRTFRWGDMLDGVLSGERVGIRLRNAAQVPREQLFSAAESIKNMKPVSEDAGSHIRNNLENILESISLFWLLLDEIIASVADVVVVGGDRNVLDRDATSVLVRPFPHDRELGLFDIKSTMSVLASTVAHDNSKNKKFREILATHRLSFFGAVEPPSSEKINSWLEILTRFGPTYELKCDAYLLEQKVGEKRAPYADGSVDSFADFVFLKLYVSDSYGRSIDLSDVGSGISHVLPVICQLWAHDLVFIQQPELHLHPSSQCQLGDVFISAKAGGKRAIIETHSEHMLLRILRRVRETSAGLAGDETSEISSKDIALYYFDPRPDGSTDIREIRISKDGGFIDRWPRGFFTERAGELF